MGAVGGVAHFPWLCVLYVTLKDTGRRCDVVRTMVRTNVGTLAIFRLTLVHVQAGRT